MTSGQEVSNRFKAQGVVPPLFPGTLLLPLMRGEGEEVNHRPFRNVAASYEGGGGGGQPQALCNVAASYEGRSTPGALL